MEWPLLDIQKIILQNDPRGEHQATEMDEEYLADLTSTMITKEIYSRAANAAISDITIDHVKSGLKARVDAFLIKLRNVDLDDWQSSEYRRIARDFTELMAGSKPRARALDMSNAGLDAVHQLFQYHVPPESCSETSMAAKDAFVLCHSFQKLDTVRMTGTRAPDIDFRFGLLTEPPANDADLDDDNALFGIEACNEVNGMYEKGMMETSAASLAKHTLTNSNLVSRLARKTFVVLGCDHPLSPTKSLLRIPGVTVLGVPASWAGMKDVLQYAGFNLPDDTTFVYPKWNKSGFDGNLVLDRGPQIAQWILENVGINDEETDQSDDSEIVFCPMPEPPLGTTTAGARKPESVVRWAAASDLILQRVFQARNHTRKCSLWSYQSSTTCMVVPPSSTTKSNELLQQRPYHELWLHSLSMGTALTPAVEEGPDCEYDDQDGEAHTATAAPSLTSSSNHDYSIVNGIMTADGPHHMLSEHIRLWRAMVTNFAHEGNDGFPFSDSSESDYDSDDEDISNNVPSSKKEIFVFCPHIPLLDSDSRLLKDHSLLQPLNDGTAASLLAAIAIASLTDPIINRPMPVIDYTDGSNSNSLIETTPFAIFWNGSVHGGIWNCPYTLDSVSGTIGFVLGKVYEYYTAYTDPSSQQYPKATRRRSLALSSDGEETVESNTDKTLVDIVPSPEESAQDDLVQDRLDILA